MKEIRYFLNHKNAIIFIMPPVKKISTKKSNSTKKISTSKRIFRKITEIEKLNYFLYLIIVIFTGGTSQDTLVLFSEVDKYVREDYSQFRFTINGKPYFLQVEFEKMDGTKIKSRIVEIK